MKGLSWVVGGDRFGTGLRGYYSSPWPFEETVARIAAASGQPVKSSDHYKTSFDFVGMFNGRVFTLYDYKESRDVHIGGPNDLDLAGLCVALNESLSRVEPTPYEAKEYYEERKGHRWPPVAGITCTCKYPWDGVHAVNCAMNFATRVDLTPIDLEAFDPTDANAGMRAAERVNALIEVMKEAASRWQDKTPTS